MFLIDALLNQCLYKDEQLKLTCVACILFVVKFEGDVCQNLNDFIEFVSKKLKFTLQEVWEKEFTIFVKIPEYFGVLPSLFECIRDIHNSLDAIPIQSTESLIEWEETIDRYIYKMDNFEDYDTFIFHPTIKRHSGRFVNSSHDGFNFLEDSNLKGDESFLFSPVASRSQFDKKIPEEICPENMIHFFLDFE